MFEKNNNNIKKVDFQIDVLYQNKDVLLSHSLVEIMNNKYYDKEWEEKMDYQNNKIIYLNQASINNMRKEYNPKITNLYYNGKIVIDNTEYELKDFFIVFDAELNNYHIKCINKNFKNEEINYNKAVKFIDTTAFINLLNSNEIKDNKIIIPDNNTLNNTINNWDGYLHSEVKETDAIINKKMIKDDKNE